MYQTQRIVLHPIGEPINPSLILGDVKFNGKGKLNRTLPLHDPLNPWLAACEYSVQNLKDMHRITVSYASTPYVILSNESNAEEWQRFVDVQYSGNDPVIHDADNLEIAWHFLPDDPWFSRPELLAMQGTTNKTDFFGYKPRHWILSDITRKQLLRKGYITLHFHFQKASPDIPTSDFYRLFDCPTF